jgi:hypothetical protein
MLLHSIRERTQHISLDGKRSKFKIQSMNVNGKMRPIETTPGMGGEGIKENDEGGGFSCDIL